MQIKLLYVWTENFAEPLFSHKVTYGIAELGTSICIQSILQVFLRFSGVRIPTAVA